jgi:hypothetical protein
MSQAKPKGFGVTSEDVAAKLVTKINLDTDAGLHVITPNMNGNCVPVVTATYELLSQALDGWTIQAGMVVAYDNTHREWDGFFQMGHVWMYHQESGTILDPTIPSWPQQLERLQFKLSKTAFTSHRQGMAGKELLQHLDRLNGTSQIAGCDLIYLPGISGLDYVKARKNAHPAAVAQVLALHQANGGNWSELTQKTASCGHCTDALMRLR